MISYNRGFRLCIYLSDGNNDRCAHRMHCRHSSTIQDEGVTTYKRPTMPMTSFCEGTAFLSKSFYWRCSLITWETDLQPGKTLSVQAEYLRIVLFQCSNRHTNFIYFSSCWAKHSYKPLGDAVLKSLRSDFILYKAMYTRICIYM